MVKIVIRTTLSKDRRVKYIRNISSFTTQAKEGTIAQINSAISELERKFKNEANNTPK